MMLTPLAAAVTATATTSAEFDESPSSSAAATPRRGVVLASAGARGTHGDGSIVFNLNAEQTESLSERGEREKAKVKKNSTIFFVFLQSL